MRKAIFGGIAVAAVLSGLVAGYRLGAGAWPDLHALRANRAGGASDVSTVGNKTATERKVLYWTDPDGKHDFSAGPRKTADGRDYLPVYDDQEPDFAENRAKAPPSPNAGERKLLYYRNPMGLPDTSPVPKKDWMGMDYIAVYEGEEQGGSTVKVSLDKVQRSGVRTAPVELRRLSRLVRAPGIAKPDERTLHTVTLRADGFIEKLYVNETGRYVAQGEPLFRVYSPQMVAVQVDYRNANPAAGTRDARGAEQRLRNLGMPDSVLDTLRQTREPVIAFNWPSPVSGVVMRKQVVEGQMVKAGDEMFRLADLSSIWVIADVSEQDIGQIALGAKSLVSFRAFPGESFEGRVTFILHELEMATRTAKVRIEVGNPDHRIKHEMFADVEIDVGADEADRLVVPVSAVIDSGNRQVVLVEKGEGLYEPRPVKLGARGEGFAEIREGVVAGEQVVVTGNFLIDAESNLQAALQAFRPEPLTTDKTDGKP
jgi:Cu(I)/Ag(I) efflux system membrane fusion protein